jgi:hypothetical protein
MREFAKQSAFRQSFGLPSTYFLLSANAARVRDRPDNPLSPRHLMRKGGA